MIEKEEDIVKLLNNIESVENVLRINKTVLRPRAIDLLSNAKGILQEQFCRLARQNLNRR